jgi:Transposase
MIEAASTIKRHWDGILRWFDSKIANGLVEGINSLVYFGLNSQKFMKWSYLRRYWRTTKEPSLPRAIAGG